VIGCAPSRAVSAEHVIIWHKGRCPPPEFDHEGRLDSFCAMFGCGIPSSGKLDVQDAPIREANPAARGGFLGFHQPVNLKKLYADDVPRGVAPGTVDNLRKMLAFLDEMQDPEELRALPSWKAHTLTGGRKGTWSLSVTANRRLTFRVDADEGEIYDVNLEDYH
jgi:toxin HigB-1